MVYTLNDNLIEKINLLRQKLEYSILENNCTINQEIINMSQKLDNLLVIYYQHEYL